MLEFKKIRCPFCNKLITESTLEYDFENTKAESTNRYVCGRCKRTVYYTVRGVLQKQGI
jgi:phage FluMu protein Com